MHEKTWWLPHFVWKGNSCISFTPSWGPIPKSLPPARTNLTELQTCSSVLHYLLDFSRLLQLSVRENFSKLNCYKRVWVFCQYKPPTLGCIFAQGALGPACSGCDTLTQIPGLRAAALPENELLRSRLSKRQSQMPVNRTKQQDTAPTAPEVRFSRRIYPQLHL